MQQTIIAHQYCQPRQNVDRQEARLRSTRHAAEAMVQDLMETPTFEHDGRIAFADFVVNNAAVDTIGAYARTGMMEEVSRQQSRKGKHRRAQALRRIGALQQLPADVLYDPAVR